MKLSIVTTLYHSSRYIEEFYARCLAAAARLPLSDLEFVFVNDGSPDNSLEKAVELARTDSRIKVADLSRNFGHHRAMMAGLETATGDYIFLLDIDLEDQPEWLPAFWNDLKNKSDVDLIYGVQEKRKGGWQEILSGHLFFWFLDLFSDVPLPKNETVARLMTRRFADDLLKFKERELVFSGLCVLTGYRREPHPVKKAHKGSTTYTFVRKFDLAVNYVASFSRTPLLIIFYAGVLVILLSLGLVARIVFLKLWYGTPLQGWSSLITSILLMGGLMMFSIGILGIYLSKVFIEVKARPTHIVRRLYQFSQESL